MASHCTTFNKSKRRKMRQLKSQPCVHCTQLVSKQRITKYATYVQRKSTARSRNCYGNATMGYLCIAVHTICNYQQCKSFQCCHGSAAMGSLRILTFNNVKLSLLPWKCNNEFPSQSCQQYHRARVLRIRF